MVKSQINHQESVTYNLQQLTSNLELILPTPYLWFQILLGDLIIVPLIMMVLRFTLYSFQLYITMNQFQIQTPFQLNQLMMVKWTISWNYSIQNMMKTFWILNYRCFRLDWWSPLLKQFIQYILC